MHYIVIEHSEHFRTLNKCRKHSPAARVFCISFVFSNARRVLSQRNTRLRVLYLLIKSHDISTFLVPVFLSLLLLSYLIIINLVCVSFFPYRKKTFFMSVNY